MNNTQLYLAIGMPSAIALIGILVNIGYFIVLNTRMMALEARIDSLSTSLTGAINELDKRLTRVEIKLGIQP
jgi:hypothetical protein